MEQDKMQLTTPVDTSELIRTAQRQWHDASFPRTPQQAEPRTTALGISLAPLATPLDWPEELYLVAPGIPW